MLLRLAYIGYSCYISLPPDYVWVQGSDTGNYQEVAWFSSVQFSRSVMSDSLRPHESQHARLPCPSPTPGVHSNPCPSSRWCHPAISSSVIPFSSCPQSLPASESFPMSQLFAWGGQSTGVSASMSVLPKNTQDWSPLGWMFLHGWISLHDYYEKLLICVTGWDPSNWDSYAIHGNTEAR